MNSKILFLNETIITSKYFTVGQDWEVPIPGFFIISPLRNLKSIDEFTDKEATDFISLIRKVRIGMREVLKIDDVYLFQNEDSKHGFHMWMFPRHSWMESFGRKIESVKPIMNYATKNMLNENVLKNVRDSIKIMKEFMMN
jgi:diadenosine tetraphosphate (Ap4A) HIT family hydrolase